MGTAAGGIDVQGQAGLVLREARPGGVGVGLHAVLSGVPAVQGVLIGVGAVGGDAVKGDAVLPGRVGHPHEGRGCGRGQGAPGGGVPGGQAVQPGDIAVRQRVVFVDQDGEALRLLRLGYIAVKGPVQADVHPGDHVLRGELRPKGAVGQIAVQQLRAVVGEGLTGHRPGEGVRVLKGGAGEGCLLPGGGGERPNRDGSAGEQGDGEDQGRRYGQDAQGSMVHNWETS